MVAQAGGFNDLDSDQLKCRLWGHQWNHTLTVMSRVGRKMAFELHLECLRCGGTRTDVVLQGIAEKRAYTYADGYLIEGGAKAWGGRREFNRNANTVLLKRLVQPKKGVKT